MAKDLTVVLENRPGTLADMGEALGRAGINIEGLCGAVTAGSSSVHVLVEDAAGALQTLKANGFEVSDELAIFILCTLLLYWKYSFTTRFCLDIDEVGI